MRLEDGPSSQRAYYRHGQNESRMPSCTILGLPTPPKILPKVGLGRPPSLARTARRLSSARFFAAPYGPSASRYRARRTSPSEETRSPTRDRADAHSRGFGRRIYDQEGSAALRAAQ